MVPIRNGFFYRTPAVAWRMLSLDSARGSVLLLHQTGVTDVVDTGPGGYLPDACGPIVQTGLSLLTPGEPSPVVASGLGNLPLAIDVALSPDRQKVALAVAGNGLAQGATVVELPLAAAMPGPSLPCTFATEERIRTPPPGQVVAVSYGPSGVLFAQTREPATLWRSDTGVTTSLAADSRSDTGHFLFHANSGGGIACASCHPEGGEDGRVWNFVCAGPRRTQSMRGGIGPTAPFHWDGSELDMPRLLDDVFTNRMVGPLLSGDFKQALQSWVDTIPELPAPALDSLDATSAARGKALFEGASAGCVTCHSGALFTNNATLDVGTGRAFQVPSLRGIAYRAPFMHDGCAQTLRDRFSSASCGGGERHGFTSPLTATQVDDLSSYLQSL
jgi:mono/diheme cytochrome c family protein